MADMWHSGPSTPVEDDVDDADSDSDVHHRTPSASPLAALVAADDAALDPQAPLMSLRPAGSDPLHGATVATCGTSIKRARCLEEAEEDEQSGEEGRRSLGGLERSKAAKVTALARDATPEEGEVFEEDPEVQVVGQRLVDGMLDLTPDSPTLLSPQQMHAMLLDREGSWMSQEQEEVHCVAKVVQEGHAAANNAGGLVADEDETHVEALVPPQGHEEKRDVAQGVAVKEAVDGVGAQHGSALVHTPCASVPQVAQPALVSATALLSGVLGGVVGGVVGVLGTFMLISEGAKLRGL